MWSPPCASTMRYAFDDSPLPCDKKGYIYGGVIIDSMLVYEGFTSDEDGSLVLCTIGIIDMPLSAVVDTILLPLAVTLEIKYRNLCKRENQIPTSHHENHETELHNSQTETDITSQTRQPE